MTKTVLSSVNSFTGYKVTAQVGLLHLRTRMCYKNMQFILIIKFKIMILLNSNKSPLGDNYEIFFFFSKLQLSSVSPHSFKSCFSSLEYFLGYICGWVFGILGTVQAPSQQSHMEFLGPGRSYCLTFIVKRASSQGQHSLSPTLSSGGR